MKFVIFLAVAVAAAASLPLDEKPLDLPFSPFFDDEEVDSSNAEFMKEVAEREVADEYANNVEEFGLADMDQQDIEELRIKIRGNIKIKIKFSNPEEIEQSLAENEESIWVRTEGSNKAGKISIDGGIRLNKKQLNELVMEELALLGINTRNVMDRIRIAEPIEIEEIEALPENPEDDSADLPRLDVTSVLAMKEERVRDEDKSIWIRVKDNDGGVKFAFRGVADVEELGNLEIEGIDAPPGPEFA